MTLRDLIEQLQDIANTAGDRLDVEVRASVYHEHEDWTEEQRLDAGAVQYHGGRVVEILTR